ncbi:hypothetical protein O1L55_38525 [Streptomyces albulus]|nr:hypothetical protein [Streptomyces noursei]
MAGLCLMAVVGLPAVWLAGGGEVALPWRAAAVPRGLPGAWTLVAAAGLLLAAGACAQAGRVLLRRCAPVLLGPGPAERPPRPRRGRGLWRSAAGSPRNCTTPSGTP